MRNRPKKQYLIFLLCMILSISFAGCKKKEEPKEKNLNVYMDVRDRHSVEIIKYIVDEYKKDNPKVKVNFNNTIGSSNIEEDINKGTEADVMFITRNTMIELTQKGLLSEMGSFYEKGKVSENYFDVISDYGRVGDKYYGVAVAPNIIEVVYNKDSLKNMNLSAPNNFNDLIPIMKKLKDSSIRIPVLLTEDVDKNAALASFIYSNTVNGDKLEAAYGGGKEGYKNIQEIQKVFDQLNTLVKSGVIDNNTFETGSETSMTALNKGNIPLAITISQYNPVLSKESVAVVKDYSFDGNKKSNIPVIVNSLLSMPTNAKNGEEAGSFIKFVLSEELQKKLTEKGYVSGNKKANANATGINKDIIENIFNSSENSILFIYSMPKKLSEEVISKINNIMTGKYTGKEWQEAVEAGL